MRVLKTRDLIFAARMRLKSFLGQNQQLQKMDFFLLQNRRWRPMWFADDHQATKICEKNKTTLVEAFKIMI